MESYRARGLVFTDDEFESYANLLDVPANRKLRERLPSPLQLDALRRMIEVDKPIIYQGSWGFSFKQRPSDNWSISLNTVEAMERRGWLARKHFFEEWKDTRELTQKGRDLPLALWQAKARGDSLLVALDRLS